MGTRHLIAVQLDGEYRIAQYGQWDGYPDGQGVSVLAFAKSMNRERFIDALRKCRFATDEDYKRWMESAGIPENLRFWSMEQVDAFNLYAPQVSRDVSSRILQMVEDSDGLVLKNSINFANDSLFCKFAYVIDLDANTLEVYRGFNHEPVTEGRFVLTEKPKDSDYYPVKLLHSFSLNSLPEEQEFLTLLNPQEEEAV